MNVRAVKRIMMSRCKSHKAATIKGLLLIVIMLAFFISTVYAGRGIIHISVSPASELAVSVDFKDESGDRVLTTGEKGRIIITVINNGKAESKNVSARIIADKAVGGLKYVKKVSFGNMPVGKIVKKEVPISPTGNIGKDTVTFFVSVKDSNGFESGPIEVAVGLKAEMKPKLVVQDFGINDKSNNLQIEPRERVILTVRIKNTGAGIARAVSVEIDYGKDITICGSGITHFEIGKMFPGQFEDVKFSFYADKNIKRGERIPLDVKIAEERPEFSLTVPLDIKMNAIINSSQNLY
jgi:hypothetical protein